MVRLTDRPDMTLDVYRGRKTTIQQYNQERFKVVHSLTMPILAMHIIYNSTCLRRSIQDHYGPLVLNLKEKVFVPLFFEILGSDHCPSCFLLLLPLWDKFLDLEDFLKSPAAIYWKSKLKVYAEVFVWCHCRVFAWQSASKVTNAQLRTYKTGKSM